MQVLVLSPHRDDAAFSCALLLMSLLQAGHSVQIVNIFTISAYAPYDPESSQKRVEHVSHLRRQEDISFVNSLTRAASSESAQVNLIDLSWKDFPLRWETDDDASLAPCLLRSSEIETLSEAFRSLPSTDVILCPQALGGHADHRLTCRAAQKAFDLSSIAYYEDLPYACGELAKPSPELGDSELMQEVWLSPRYALPGQKRDFCLHYSSQINGALAELMDRYGQLHGGERVVGMPEPLRKLRTALSLTGATA